MYVKFVDLANVKGFEKLRFDFTRPDGSFHGWTVIVGGNASGKSTLLKAIALALAGPVAGHQLMATPAGWLRREQHLAEADIDLAWDTDADQFLPESPIDARSELIVGVRWRQDREQQSRRVEVMSFTIMTSMTPPALKEGRPAFDQVESKDGVSSSNGPWNGNLAGWFSAGYGPMRRLSGNSPDAARDSTEGGALSRLITLFREDAALSESEAWLKLNHARHLESSDPQIKELLDGVRSLLGDGLLPHGMKISRITVDHVYVRDSLDIELPMRDISDGCRSVYAMVLDIVRGMAEAYGIPGLFVAAESGRLVIDRPGVVLIDEIEAHLHPGWQSEIPEWLKEHFPRLQFIVSTHSALVAQAADPNGVFVLPSQDEPGRAPRQLDPHEYNLLRLRRAEKTLLGSAFGLKTTRSKWAVDRIAKWKRLNAKDHAGATLSAQERSDLVELKAQMEVAFSESAPAGAEEAVP